MSASRESEKHLRLALDAVQVGTFEWDLPTRRLVLSRKLESLWGFQQDEFCGSYEEFAARIHPPDRSTLETELARCIAEKEPLTTQLRVVWPDGGLHVLEIRGELSLEPSGQAHKLTGAVLGVDTTALRERDEEIERLNQLYRALSNINQAIVWTKTRPELFEKICHTLTHEGGFSLAWIGAHLPDTGEIVPVAISGDNLEVSKIEIDHTAESRGDLATALLQGRPYICNDIATLPWRAKLPSGDFQAMACFPIRELGAIVGLLNVYDKKVGAFGARRIALLAEATDDISFALDNLGHEERRLQAERRLRQERDFSDAVLESLPGVLYLYDESGKFLRWNKNFEKVTGYSAAEIETMQPLDFFSGPEKKRVADRIADVFASGYSNVEAEFSVKNGKGAPHHFTGVKTVIDGKPCLVGVGIDISERLQAEAASRASETRYRALFEYAPDGILIADAGGTYLDANPSMCRTLGYSLEDLVGSNASHILAEGEFHRVSKALETIRAGMEFHQEWIFRRKDGSVFPAEVLATMMPDGSLLAMVRDITERRKAEARLRDSEALLRLAGRAAKLGGWSIELPSYQGTWSEEVCAIHEVPFGTNPSAEEAIAYCAPQFQETVRRKVQRCADRGEPFDLELQIITANNRRVWVRGIGHPEYDADGAVTRLVGAFQDIDEQRKLEEQLRQSQKMEAVGHLAGGVAHDFNNILCVILGYTELILGDLDGQDALRPDIEEVHQAGKRAKDLTGKLLVFSRRKLVEPEVLDIGEVVKGMEVMVRRLLGAQIELSVATDFSVGKVLADSGQIEQVIMNLAINARDAMPEGGKLSIETIDTTLDAAYCADHLDLAPGPYVMLAVTDSGFGMDAATLERIFEPFFTTKEQGKGTGLGLATVFGIVKQSRGHIAVYSEPDRGTTFTLYFPRTDRVARGAPAAPPPTVTLRGSESILLVEDDQPVRNIMATILRRQGYSVLEAGDGEEALKVCEELTSDLHLLVTDLVMPRMGGHKLAEQLGRLRPKLSVLYVSGCTEPPVLPPDELERPPAFLAKPISPTVLLSKVREVLNSQVDIH